MKKLFTLLALVLTLITNAQAPQGFNYQATVRNSTGALIVNQNVLVKFNVYQNAATGTLVYSENQTVDTDDLGHINLVVGQGTASTGTFSAINWGTGNYYLGIELNTGAGYVIMGTTQLMSVPYALFSGNSCNLCLPTGANIGDVLSWNGSTWIATPAGNLNSTSVSTITATNVTSNSAISGGTISSDGGNTIISKGVCWSITINPTINDSHTNEGSGANNFTSTISNLAPGTNYYYRAYITNSNGTYYGSTYVLSIPVTLPTVTTTEASFITINSAVSGGNVTSDGGAAITARGVCWDPATILGNHTVDGSGLGSFTSNLTNLQGNADIWVRAYATNSAGTAYGEPVFVATYAPNAVADFDGNLYSIVSICNQAWTKSNLNVTHYRNGDVIPQVTDPTQWANLTTGAWCYYNNDPSNGAVYGKLYNWYAVNDPRGLAPQGWHIPTDSEWTILTNCLGGESLAGGKMKETSSSQTDTYSWYYDSGATNLSGFSAKPASWRYTESSGTLFGGNYPIKMSAFWWSSTEFGSVMASLRNIQASSNSLYMQVLSHVKSNGLSVRLVKD